MKEKNLCYGCLKSGHNSKDCRNRHSCDSCKGRHPTLLHDDDYTKANSGMERLYLENHHTTLLCTPWFQTDLEKRATPFLWCKHIWLWPIFIFEICEWRWKCPLCSGYWKVQISSNQGLNNPQARVGIPCRVIHSKQRSEGGAWFDRCCWVFLDWFKSDLRIYQQWSMSFWHLCVKQDTPNTSQLLSNGDMSQPMITPQTLLLGVQAQMRSSHQAGSQDLVFYGRKRYPLLLMW